MDKIEKIRAEIERQLTAHDAVDHLDAFEVGKAWNRGHRKALDNLLSFLDTLEEEPDKSLEEAVSEQICVAADKHIHRVIDAAGHPGWDWTTQDIADAFKAGAEWQYQKDRGEFAKLKAKELSDGYNEGIAKGKEQMLKDAVEFECIGKKVKMTIQELINYYIDQECCDVADECGF